MINGSKTVKTDSGKKATIDYEVTNIVLSFENKAIYIKYNVSEKGRPVIDVPSKVIITDEKDYSTVIKAITGKTKLLGIAEELLNKYLGG